MNLDSLWLINILALHPRTLWYTRICHKINGGTWSWNETQINLRSRLWYNAQEHPLLYIVWQSSRTQDHWQPVVDQQIGPCHCYWFHQYFQAMLYSDMLFIHFSPIRIPHQATGNPLFSVWKIYVCHRNEPRKMWSSKNGSGKNPLSFEWC